MLPIDITVYLYLTTVIFYTALLLYILIKKTLISSDMKIFFLYLFICLLCEVVSFVSVKIFHISNYFIYHCTNILEFIFIYWMFTLWDAWEYRTLLIIIGTILFIPIAIFSLFIEPWNEIPIISITFKSTVLTLFSLRALYNTAIVSRMTLWKNPRFYLSFAFLLYSVPNAISTPFGIYQVKNIPMTVIVISNLITNLLFSVSLLCIYLPERKIQKLL